MLSTRDEQSNNVWCAYLSNATLEECKLLIGKTVERVEASEYQFTIIFTDGTECSTSGSRWDGCSLGVTIEKPNTDVD